MLSVIMDVASPDIYDANTVENYYVVIGLAIVILVVLFFVILKLVNKNHVEEKKNEKSK